MAERYHISIGELITGASQIDNIAQEFKGNYDNIFRAVDEMIQRAYVSPDALVTARKISEYRSDMDKMYARMMNYADLARKFANGTRATQVDNVSNIKFNGVSSNVK